MNYSIKVTTKDNEVKTIEINGSSKVAVHSADKIQILGNESGVLSFFGSKSQNIENLIAVKNGNNLEIILENGDILTFTNFYSFKNATSIEFVDGDDNVHTLLSTDSTMADMGGDSFLVYTQGSESTLLSMSASNTSLSSALSNKFNTDTSPDDSFGGYGQIGLLALGAAAGGSANSGGGFSLSSLTAIFRDSTVIGISYEITTTLGGAVIRTGVTDSEGKFVYNAGEIVTFKVGGITVGSINAADVNADGIVMPQDLAGVARTDTSNAEVKKIARFLQTLDSDGDASNGITIDATSEAKVNGSGTKDLADTNVLITDVIDNNEGIDVVTEDAAVIHLNTTTNEAAAGAVTANFSGTIIEAMASNSGISSATTTVNITGSATIAQLIALKKLIDLDSVTGEADGTLTVGTIEGTEEEIANALSTTTSSVTEIITVTGTNDAPVATADTGVVNENSSVTVDVLANDTDIDNGASFTLDIVSASKGTATIDDDNKLVFEADAESFDNLAEGVEEVVTVTYTMSDEFGATSTSTATITVTGTNDQPVVSDVTAVGTDTIGDSQEITTYDTLDLDDYSSSVLYGQTFIAQDTALSEIVLDMHDSANGAFKVQITDLYGEVIYLSDTVTVNGDGQSENLVTIPVNQLNEGFIVDNSYNLRLVDAQNDSVKVEYSVFNDGKSIAGDGQGMTLGNSEATWDNTYDLKLKLTFGNGTVILENDTTETTTFTGSLATVTDLDTTDTHEYTIVTGTAAVDNEAVTITDANITVTTAGEYTLAGNFEALAADETATVTFNYVATDNSGVDNAESAAKREVDTSGAENAKSDAKTVTITITGTNDAPVITSSTEASSGEASAAGNLDDGTAVAVTVATGTLTSTDVDNGATATWTATGNETTAFGTFAISTSGVWTYTMDSTIGSIAEGENYTQTFEATVTDDKGATDTQAVTVTIKGTNDSPVITSTTEEETTGTATEAGNLDDGTVVDATVATGTLTSTDVDTSATATWTATGNETTAYGTFAISTAGVWTYTMDSTTGSAADKLTAGDTFTETFEATVTDDKGATDTQTVTVTITGTNDAPVATVDTGAVYESSSVTVDVLANDTDQDNGATSTLDTVSASKGTATIVDDKLVFEANAEVFDHLAQGATEDVVVSYTMSDQFEVTSTSTATITVTGTNDQPIVSDVTAVGTDTIDNGQETATFDTLDHTEFSDTYPYAQTFVAQDTTLSEIVLDMNDAANGTFKVQITDLEGTEIYLSDTVTVSGDSESESENLVTIPVNELNEEFILGSSYNLRLVDIEGSSIYVAASYVDTNNGKTQQSDGQGMTEGNADATWDSVHDLILKLTFGNGETAILESDTTETTTFTGSLATATDPDTTDTHVYTIEAGSTAVEVSNEAVAITITDENITVTTAGEYTLAGNFEALAAGETATVTFDYVATDNSGAENAESAAKAVTITVTGTNDQPIVSDVNANASGDGEGTATYDTLDHIYQASALYYGQTFIAQDTILSEIVLDMQDSASGTFKVQITDLSGAVIYLSDTVSVNGDGQSENLVTIPVNQQANEEFVLDDSYNLFLVEAVGTISIDRSYAPSNDEKTIVGDGQGMTISNTSNATWDNEHDLKLKLTFGNETVILESDTTETTIFTGSLATATDLDTTDTHEYSLVAESTEVDNTAVAITDENITVTTAGEYTLTGDFEALAAGETATVTFNYVATDDSATANAASAEATATITVTGTNDQPIVEAVNGNQETAIYDAVHGATIGFLDNNYGQRFQAQDTTLSQVELKLQNSGDFKIILNDNDGETIFTSETITVNGVGDYIATIDIDQGPGEEFEIGEFYNLWIVNESGSDIVAGYTNANVIGGNGQGMDHFQAGADNAATWDANHNLNITLTFGNGETVTETVILESDTTEVTTFTGSLATATDLDTTDTHEYSLVAESTAVDNEAVTITDVNITVTTAGEYTLTGNFDALAAGETATVTFNYVATDNSGAENAESAPQTATITVTGVDDETSGIVSITSGGTLVVGSIMTASTSALADAEGMGTFTYLWSNQATTASYELTNEDAGENLTVTVTHTDAKSGVTELTSSAVSLAALVPTHASLSTYQDLVTDFVDLSTYDITVTDETLNAGAVNTLAGSVGSITLTGETITGTAAEILAAENAVTTSEGGYTAQVSGGTIAQIDAILVAQPDVTIDATTVSDNVAILVSYLLSNANAGHIATTTDLVVNDLATVSQLTFLDANAGTVAASQLSDTATNLAASAFVGEGTNVIVIAGTASISELSTIDTNNGAGSLDYSAATITDIAASLAATDGAATAGMTAYVVASTDVTFEDTATIAQLEAVETAVGETGSITDAGITDASLTIVAADGAGLNDLVGTGTAVTFNTVATIAQLEAVETAVGEAGSITDAGITDASLTIVAADGTGLNDLVGSGTDVTFEDTATIAQLEAVETAVGETGTTTYTSLTDTAANLITDAGVFLNGSIVATVTGNASESQMDTILTYTSGVVTFDTLELTEESTFNLSGLESSFSGLDITNIDTTDGAANALTITLADVIGLSDATNTLTIDIDANDTHNLATEEGDWVQQVNTGAVGYDVYTQVSGEETYTVKITGTKPAFDTISTDNLINASEETEGFALTGTGKVGATVTVTGAIFEAGNTAVVDGSGHWAMAVVAGDLTPNAANALSATQTDAAGNVSGAGTTTITTDLVAAAAPAFDDISTDNLINAEETAEFNLTGTGEVGATVTVTGAGFLDGKTAVVDGSGNWTMAVVAEDLNLDADNILTATQTGVAGNISDAGTTTITTDLGVAAPAFDTISIDNLINASEETAGFDLTGTGEVGATVTVAGAEFAGGNTAVVDGSGHWTMAVVAGELNLDADNILTATQTDVAGNQSTDGTTTITVDAIAPTITVAAIANDNIINATEDDEDITISGTTDAEVGQTVTVTVGENTYTTTVETTSGDEETDGNSWSVTIPTEDIQALPEDGQTSVSVSVSDVAGNPATAAVATLTRDTTADAPETTTVVFNDTDGIVNDSESTTASFTVTNLDDDATAVVTFTDGEGAVTANVEEDGTATADLSELAEGTITATIDITDTAGNTATGISHTTTLDTTNPTVVITNDHTGKVISTDSTVQYTVTFDESVTGFEVGDLDVVGGVVSEFAGSGTTYTFNVTAADGSIADITVDIAAGVANDAAGNASTIATQSSQQVDMTGGDLSGTAAELVSIFAGTSYQHSGTVTITDAATVLQFNTIDENTSTNVVLAGGLNDIAAAYVATNGEPTSGLTNAITQDATVNITVSDAATIVQLTAIGALEGTGTVTAATLTDTAANLVTDATTNEGTGTYLTPAATAVTVEDAATIAQLKTIDALAGTVTYTSITDSAADLITDAGVLLNGSIDVTISGKTSIGQMGSIAGYTLGAVNLDTLELNGQASLDLANLAFVESFDTLDITNIDATDGTANALTITLADVIGLSDATNTLTIDIDANDTHNLANEGGGWVQQVNAGAGGYDVYTQTSDGAEYTVKITGTDDQPIVSDVNANAGVITATYNTLDNTKYSYTSSTNGQRFQAKDTTLSQIELDMLDASTGSFRIVIADSTGTTVYTSEVVSATGEGDNIVTIPINQTPLQAFTQDAFYDMRVVNEEGSDVGMEFGSPGALNDGQGMNYYDAEGSIETVYDNDLDLTLKLTFASGETVILENDASEVTTFTGSLATATDLDAADTHVYSLVANTTAVVGNEAVTITDENITVTTAGEYTLAGNFEALAAGETATVTFNYVATDNSGAENAESDAKTVTVTITGTNDTPTISAYEEVTDVAESSLTGSISTEDVGITDIDTSDTHSFVALTNAATTVTDTDNVGLETITVSMTETGEYTLTGVSTEKLGAGESATVSFDVQVIDDSGAANAESAAKTVTVTVTGTNDQPVVSDVTAVGTDTITTITATYNTLDNTVESYGSSRNGQSFQAKDTTLSQIELDMVDGSTGSPAAVGDFRIVITDSTGATVYTSAVVSATGTGDNIVTIPINQTTSEEFTPNDFYNMRVVNEAGSNVNMESVSAEAADDFQGMTYSLNDGASVHIFYDNSVDLKLKLTFANNETVILENDAGEVTTFTGSLATATDLDTTDTHVYSLVANTTAVVGNEAITITDANITVTTAGEYTLAGNFEALAAGETATVTFNYVATDDSGEANAASAEATATITVTGTNDQPVVSDVNANAGSGTTVGLDTIDNAETRQWDLSLSSQTFLATEANLSSIELELSNPMVASNGTFTVQIDGEGYSYTSAVVNSSDAVSNGVFQTGSEPTGIVSVDMSGASLTPDTIYTLSFNVISGNPAMVGSAGDSTDQLGAYYDFSFYHKDDLSLRMTYGSNETVILENDASETTTFTGSLATATDLDTTDTHVYSLVANTTAVVGNEAVIITDANITVTTAGEYTLTGNFEGLAEGETATVTFNYVATDNSGTANAASAEATATITVTGVGGLVLENTQDYTLNAYQASRATDADGAGMESYSGVLTVTQGDGDDSITTGSGNDVIYGGAGNDTVVAGAGDDTMVIIGEVAAGQYVDGDIDASLSGVIANAAAINGQTVSDTATGGSYAGGANTAVGDTLHIYGTVDMNTVTLTGIENIVIHSDVTFSAAQITALNTAGVSMTGDGGSTVRIDAENSATTVNMDNMTLSNLGQLDIGDNLTTIASQANIDAISTISSGTTATALKAATATDLVLTGKSVFGGATLLSSTDVSAGAITAPVNGATDITSVLTMVNTMLGATNGSDGNSVNNLLNTLLRPVVANVEVDDYELTVGNQASDNVLSGRDGVTNFIAGGSANDTLIGGNGATNFIYAGAELPAPQAINSITGGDYMDFVMGGAGVDIIDGKAGNDFLAGDDGDDIITGGIGNDFIDGGIGNDTITGGTGSDIIMTGTGTDTIVFASGDSTIDPTLTPLEILSSADIIADFSTADIIDYASALAIGGDSETAATAGNAQINLNGLAVFHADDNTLGEMIAAVVADLSVGEADPDGKMAIFTDMNNTYVYITDNDSATTTGDTFITLVGTIGIDLYDTITIDPNGNAALGATIMAP
jgi:VCBS repeat-containing protein